MKEKIKILTGVISFLSAMVIGFIAMFLPVKGIIDTSVLWFIAQLLVFTSNIFGFEFKNVFKSDKNLQSSKKD